MSSLSFNTAPGGLMYSPMRDFAYNYTQMITCIIRAFNKEIWPQVLEVTAKASNVSEAQMWEHVCAAKATYCTFLEICCEDPAENVSDVLKRSGFLDVPVEAQIAWCAMLGQIITGQLFQGIRDTTPLGEANPHILKLLQVGRDAARLMNKQDELDKRLNHTDLTVGLALYVKALRESGVEQAAIRTIITNIFNTEQQIN